MRLRVSSYRSEGVASKERDLKPRGDEGPCGIEAGELREVGLDVGGGSLQDGRLPALSVEDFPRPTVVHISPERCHRPPVPSDRKGHRSELRHLPQEGHQAVVVYLRRRFIQ